MWERDIEELYEDTKSKAERQQAHIRDYYLRKEAEIEASIINFEVIDKEVKKNE